MNLKALLLTGWLIATWSLGALLTLLHESPLPAPEARPGAVTASWTMVHGLALRCPCSRRIVVHLLKRRAGSSSSERVLLVDSTPEVASSLQAAGFLVESVEATQLTAQGFVAVPGLVIRAPDGSVAYAGAHSPTRSGPIDDLALLAAARDGQTRRPFAVLGCAISDALNARIDPLSLKFPSWPGVSR